MKGFDTQNESAEKFRKRRKKEYGELYDEIAHILFEADPIGLNFEANIDEYDSEASRIVPLLRSGKNIDNLAQKIREIFLDMFSNDTQSVDRKIGIYREIAEKIWKLKEQVSL